MSTEECDGADEGVELAWLVDGMVEEAPDVGSLGTEGAVGVAAVPGEGGEMRYEQAVAVVDIKLSVEDADTRDSEAIVVVSEGGEDVGREEGDTADGYDGDGGIAALGTSEFEGDNDAVSGGRGCAAEDGACLVLALPVEVPDTVGLLLATDVVSLEIEPAVAEGFRVDLEFGLGDGDRSQGDGGVEGTERVGTVVSKEEVVGDGAGADTDGGEGVLCEEEGVERLGAPVEVRERLWCGTRGEGCGDGGGEGIATEGTKEGGVDADLRSRHLGDNDGEDGVTVLDGAEGVGKKKVLGEEMVVAVEGMEAPGIGLAVAEGIVRGAEVGMVEGESQGGDGVATH